MTICQRGEASNPTGQLMSEEGRSASRPYARSSSKKCDLIINVSPRERSVLPMLGVTARVVPAVDSLIKKDSAT